MFTSVGIVSRVDRKQALRLAAEIIPRLENKKTSIKLELSLARRLKRPDLATPLEEMKTDLIVIIGGDGTILRTCLKLPKPEPPILAINMGARGFLTEVAPEDAFPALDHTLDGYYNLERTTKLALRLGDTRLPDALNEVSITSLRPAKLLRMRVWKGDELVGECHSDGAVIASQTGSTGYSLSAGGPVIDPEVQAFVFTPIAPLTVFHPIVFSTNSKIRVELYKPKRSVIVIDGYFQTRTTSKLSNVTVTKSEYKSTFVRFEGGFYNKLKGRFLFSEGLVR